jgi:thiol-disulfide isomerase/thioredoxin
MAAERRDLGIDSVLWQTGLSLEQFVSQIESPSDRQALQIRLATVALAPYQKERYASTSQPIWIVVLTEGWCGDSLMVLPIVVRLAEALPNAELRIFVRSQAPELSQAYAARGVVNIPTVSFFDEHFHELGTWVERSKAAHRQVAAWKDEHPEFGELISNEQLDPAERRARLQPFLQLLRAEMAWWYSDHLQQATLEEFDQILATLSR